MKGIILPGGTRSRLFPLTKVTNKHLLPVGRDPMITDVNNHLTPGALQCDRLSRWWTDAGTFDSLALANELVRPR